MILSPALLKNEVFEKVTEMLQNENLRISYIDNTKPWGGFFVIEETDSEHFIKVYFPHLTKAGLEISGKLTPKILVVAPEKKLSWQYHHRREEIWKLIAGEVAVVTSHDNTERNIKNLAKGNIVQLKKEERHRLVGLKNWGLVAEIWQHTDFNNPSNEEDIVRLQDDFGRQF